MSQKDLPSATPQLKIKTPTTFFTLPRELRHQILLYAFDGTFTAMQFKMFARFPTVRRISYEYGKWCCKTKDWDRLYRPTPYIRDKLKRVDKRIVEDVGFIFEKIRAEGGEFMEDFDAGKLLEME